MSSGVEWALDKVAELAGRYGEDDALLEVLVTLVGALDPPPQRAALEPAARRVGKLRLARLLDHPGDLRLGAVRLLTALDAPRSDSSAKVSPMEEMASSEPAPVPAPEERGGVVRRSSRTNRGRIILSFPAPGTETDAEPGRDERTSEAAGSEPELAAALQRSAVRAPRAFGRVIAEERRHREDEFVSESERSENLGRGGGNSASGVDADLEPARVAPSTETMRPPETIRGPHIATVGSTLTLGGTAPPGDGPVMVEGSYDDGRTWQTLSRVESADGRYAAQIVLSRRGLLQMRIVFADASSEVGSIRVR